MHQRPGTTPDDTMELRLPGAAGGAARHAPSVMPPEPSPVFVDSSGHRQRRVRRWGRLLVVPAIAYVALLVSALLGGPTVQAPFLPSAPAPRTPAPGPAPTDAAAPSRPSDADPSSRPDATPTATRIAAGPASGATDPSAGPARTTRPAPAGSTGPTAGPTTRPTPQGVRSGRPTAPPGQGGGKPTAHP
ncbi:hypothetical protein ACGF1Z_24980 [Streptomyces sp. NPDC048018]|uniref:hypothetical protein n=1 Tax=Streptomyces sp. NPDC048018 TaxID=3365499 RepID=UPI003719E415